MNQASRSVLARVLSDQRGQVLPWMALLMVLFLGFAGLSMDLGQAYVAYRELQASSDAAALAGGYAMSLAGESATQVQSYAASFGSASSCSYSGGCPGANVNPGLPSATIAVTLSCNNFVVTKVGIPCAAGPGSNNAIQVVQTAQLKTPFIHVLNMLGVHTGSSLTLRATSTASMLGNAGSQYNVAIVLDSTGSMSSNDTDNPTCHTAGLSKEQCALSGIQTLLSGLIPCGPGSTASTCTSSFDSVGLFTFPNVQANTAAYATTPPCSSRNTPQGAAYMAPVIGAAWSPPSSSSSHPNYEITSSSSTDGFLSNFSSTNAAGGSITTTSQLGVATGADSSCDGLQTPISGQGTYLPGAIYAAQSALIAAQTANPGSLNAMIILTDGDANATNPLTDSSGNALTSRSSPPLGTGGGYPSLTDQCNQAIGAAQYASMNGTAVYVVAYQAGTSGCSTDASAQRNPCTNLQAMSLQAGETTPYTPYLENFYSDATSANGGTCTSPDHPSLTLNQVFQSVTNGFTRTRLIPN